MSNTFVTYSVASIPPPIQNSIFAEPSAKDERRMSEG